MNTYNTWLKKWNSFYHHDLSDWEINDFEIASEDLHRSPLINLLIHLQVDLNFHLELCDHPLYQKHLHPEKKLPFLSLFLRLFSTIETNIVLNHLKKLHDWGWIQIELNAQLHLNSLVLLSSKSLTLLYQYFPELYFKKQSFGKYLKTSKTWQDVIYPKAIKSQVFQIVAWHQYHSELIALYKNYAKHSSKGYKVLFSGPPGSGKTLAAQLIAKELGLDCLAIDMAEILSKYIGESEQRIKHLFEENSNSNHLLFFDEAESLFQDRKGAGQHHQKDLSNYLLQKIEQFEGLIILATNLPEVIDPAFKRRFHQHIRFKNLNNSERLILWYQLLSGGKLYAADIPFEDLLTKYPLSPAQLSSLLQQLYLHSHLKQENIISKSTFETVLQEVLKKNGKKYITESQIIEK